jgi:hypothetical protein
MFADIAFVEQDAGKLRWRLDDTLGLMVSGAHNKEKSAMPHRCLRICMQAGLAAALLLSAAAPAARADERDFTLVNDSSIDIVDLYITHVAEEQWGDDILGEDVLPAGDHVRVMFVDPAPGFCRYDLKVTVETGEDSVVNNVDLCQTDVISFHH